MKKKVYCNLCGDELNQISAMGGCYINADRIGYGSKHDGEPLNLNLCDNCRGTVSDLCRDTPYIPYETTFGMDNECFTCNMCGEPLNDIDVHHRYSFHGLQLSLSLCSKCLDELIDKCQIDPCTDESGSMQGLLDNVAKDPVNELISDFVIAYRVMGIENTKKNVSVERMLFEAFHDFIAEKAGGRNPDREYSVSLLLQQPERWNSSFVPGKMRFTKLRFSYGLVGEGGTIILFNDNGTIQFKNVLDIDVCHGETGRDTAKVYCRTFVETGYNEDIGTYTGKDIIEEFSITIE